MAAMISKSQVAARSRPMGGIAPSLHEGHPTSPSSMCLLETCGGATACFGAL